MKQSDIFLPTMNGLVVLQASRIACDQSQKSTSDIHSLVIASTATNVALDSEEENHFLLIPTPFNNN